MWANRLKTPEYYRARAVSCERAAAAAVGAEDRATMTYLANRWHKLSDDAAAARETQSAPSNRKRDHGNRGRTAW